MKVLIDLAPQNPITAMAKAILIQIIFFSVCVGACIIAAGERAKTVQKVFEEGSEIMFKLTAAILETAPYGIAALMADAVGSYGPKIFGLLAKFIFADYLGALLMFFIVYRIILKLIVGIDIVYFFKNIMKVWLVTASATSSSGIV